MVGPEPQKSQLRNQYFLNNMDYTFKNNSDKSSLRFLKIKLIN